MSQFNQYRNILFLLENETINSLRDKVVNVMFSERNNHFYNIFIVFDKLDFETHVHTASNFYRNLSNSNQTVARTTNREWWNLHFTGGEYVVYNCENNIAIHFMLEFRHIGQSVNELQLRIRIAKAAKSIRYQLLLNDKKTLIDAALDKYKNCISEVRLIGKYYTEKAHNKVIFTDSGPHS